MNLGEIEIVRNLRVKSHSDYESIVSKEHWSI